VPINVEVSEKLGNRVRVRVCGILISDNKLLMINHHGLYNHDFWSFPGGGVEFGESPTDTLKREFHEECGILVEPGAHSISCSVLKPPLHAVELFFNIRSYQGNPKAGSDPERGNNQIISDLQFLSWNEISQIPVSHLHPLFRHLRHPSEIADTTGFYELT
jgi:ADP-ribose pyrophosphatase YjhB (NUDIX family)